MIGFLVKIVFLAVVLLARTGVHAAESPTLTEWSGGGSSAEAALQNVCSAKFPRAAPHKLINLYVGDRVAWAQCSGAYRRDSGGCIGCGAYFRPNATVYRTFLCPTGMTLVGNVCVGQCGGGQLEDPATRACVQSERCPPGQAQVGGRCQPSSGNPANRVPSATPGGNAPVVTPGGNVARPPMGDWNPGKDGGKPECGNLVGNPCNAAIGNKFQQEVDFQGVGADPLSLVRHYNSYTMVPGSLGSKWRMTYDRRIVSGGVSPVPYLDMVRDDGQVLRFVSKPDGMWSGDGDVVARLARVPASEGDGWRYVDSDNNVETYDRDGYPIKIRYQSGAEHHLQWRGAGAIKVLERIMDRGGRSLLLDYDAAGRVTGFSDPAGHRHRYAYDASGQLTSVTRPDGSVRTYHYDEPKLNLGPFTGLLTGISDERGIRFATWTYDSDGRVVSSEHAGGVGRTTLEYRAPTVTNADTARSQTQTVVRGANGVQRHHYATVFNGAAKPTSQTIVLQNSQSVTTSRSFNNRGLVESETGLDGITYSYTYDQLGRRTGLQWPTLKTRKRTIWDQINYRWHPIANVLTQIDEPAADELRLITDLEYDTANRLIKKTQRSSAAGIAPRVWEYSYDAKGWLTEVRGPRTDAADITRYEYDTAGNLVRRVDAQGYATSWGDYDGAGRPRSMTDANGVTTTLRYDWRGQVVETNRAGEITSTQFDAIGNLVEIAFPDGRRETFSYDDAGRLTGMMDGQGRRRSYVLDTADNRLEEKLLDAEGNLIIFHRYAYDGLNRMIQSAPAGDSARATEYAWEGPRMTRSSSPLGRDYQFNYSITGLLTSVVDPQNGAGLPTTFGYSRGGFLNSVSHVGGRGGSASYFPTAFGELKAEYSSSTNQSNWSFDAAGQLVYRRDARGQEMRARYDALGRPIETRFSNEILAFEYDRGPFGIDRLTGSSDSHGRTAYAYDGHGRMIALDRTINGRSYSLRFGRLPGGHVETVTYPSGRQARYRYRGADPAGLDLDGASVVDEVAIDFPGAVKRLTWGDGGVANWRRDLAGRMDGHTSAWGSEHRLERDAAGRVTQLVGTENSWHFDYDLLDRLSGSQASAGAVVGYAYDAAGNRTRRTTGGDTEDYTYGASTRRLEAVRRNGLTWKQLTYDPAGYVESDGLRRYGYDGRGLLAWSEMGGERTTYGYNAEGLRLWKTKGERSIHYLYDLAGRLLGEYDGATGAPLAEYLWLADLPVAVVKADGIFRIHTDHLGTPRSIADAHGREVWRWEPVEAFGDHSPLDRLSGSEFEFNLRFPGQYFDKETGLFYNGFRYYDPSLGRYIQPDPIGMTLFRGYAGSRLAGQMGPMAHGAAEFYTHRPEVNHVYVYVKNTPLRYTDPLGLGPWDKLYGYGKEFWRWFHKEDPGLFRELKDPKTGQIPKEVAQPYYDAWKKEKEGGFADPSLLGGFLPWGLTPSELAPGTLWGPGTPYPTPADYDKDKGKPSCP